MSKVTGNTGVPIKACDMMYKAVFQLVLLYGREIWVVTDSMMMVLEVFYHKIARRIAEMTVGKGDGGEWEWVSVDASLEDTGIFTIREYVRRQQA